MDCDKVNESEVVVELKRKCDNWMKWDRVGSICK